MLANDLMMQAGGTPPTPPDFAVNNSVRFNSADSAYMNRTPGVAGNRQKYTISLWVKRSTAPTSGFNYLLSAGATQNSINFGANSGSNGGVLCVNWNNGSSYLETVAVYRDPSVWMHVVLAVDTTQATASSRAKLYLDGIQVTSFTTATYPPQNDTSEFCNNATHEIGRRSSNGTGYLDGYLADIYLIDGQALTPTSFGKISTLTSNWVPIAYTGTYGTTGFHLDFKSGGSAAALGTDTSGNSNTWTVNNISVTAGEGNDWLADAPSNNYCTLNPLENFGGVTIANGALDVTAGNNIVYGAWRTSTDKWFWEVTQISATSSCYLGIASDLINSFTWPTGEAFTYNQNGTIYSGSSAIGSGASYTTGDVIGFALDAAGQSIAFYKNGVLQYTATSIGAKTWRPMLYQGAGPNFAVNFGQRTFAYTPPTGFKSLNQTNLPTPITTQPYQYNNTALYTGTGAGQSIINLHLKPDLTWIKTRSTSGNNVLYDSVRGATKRLRSDDAGAETTVADSLLAFLDDGFSLGASADGDVNYNGRTYVAWNWKESVTAGFDILTGTKGAGNEAFAHSLGVKPEMFMVKNRSTGSTNWYLTHKELGSMQDYILYPNATNAATNSAGVWGGEPTSSNIYLSTSIMAQGANFVAYLFAGKEGYSKFGKYTGNGSTDGPFVYCGFKPRWVMVKRTDSTSDWLIIDTSRPGYNVTTLDLYANATSAEGTSAAIDMLSNGFKLRSSSVMNASGNYVFMAFAESPFKYPRTQFSSSQTGLNLKGLRFNSADSSYLNRTPSVAGNRKTYTLSMWVKRAKLGAMNMLVGAGPSSGQDDTNWFGIKFNSSDQLQILGWNTSFRVTTQVFRDPSAWYHIVMVVDTTLSGDNKIKLFVNGLQVSSFSSIANPSDSADTGFCSAQPHKMGFDDGFSVYSNLYLADVYLIDGQAKLPSDFAMTNATTGQWVPIIYTGTYGTNGCHLTFADSSSTAALGYDTSGNGNNWTVNNISVTNDKTQDCLSDSPTENYCTLNPLNKYNTMSMTDGALSAFGVSGSWYAALATIAMPTGKWYWEALVDVYGGAGVMVGIAPSVAALIYASYFPGGATDGGKGYYSGDGSLYSNNSGSAYGSSYGAADVIGVAFDADNGKVWFAKNGTWQNSGDPVAGTGAAATGLVAALQYMPAIGIYNYTSTKMTFNFGQRSFTYAPPTGFSALNSTNLSSPTILLPNRYFDVVTYTGTGA